jgi:hypothetical protein
VKKLLVLTTAVLLVAGLSAGSHAAAPPAQDPQAPPAPKPAAAPTTIAGKWNVTVDTGQGDMASVLEIKLDGKKVSGTLTGQQGELPIDGEFADNKLTFSIAFDTPNGSIGVTFTCTLKDEVFTGTADAGQMGQFPVRAERVKDK